MPRLTAVIPSMFHIQSRVVTQWEVMAPFEGYNSRVTHLRFAHRRLVAFWDL